MAKLPATYSLEDAKYEMEKIESAKRDWEESK